MDQNVAVRLTGCLFLVDLKLLAFLSLDQLEQNLGGMVSHGFQCYVLVVEWLQYRFEKRFHPDWC